MLSIQNQFVVATEHLKLVEDEMSQGASVQVSRDGDIPRLGLTLVGLPKGADPTKLANVLWGKAAEQERAKLPSGYENIDQLLASLRHRFRLRYANWTPTMGKNRLLGGIELLPYASVVGVPPQAAHLPEPADPPEYRGRPPVPETDPPLRPVRVGIMDVGLAPHARLEGGYLAEPGGLDLRPTDGTIRQGWQGHATFVANVILEMAPSAGLVLRTALRVKRDEPDPRKRFSMPLWHFAEKLVEFEDAGVQVLNCSVGCQTRDGQAPLVLSRAIERLSATMVIVAAAGNHGGVPPVTSQSVSAGPEAESRSAALFPAALDGVLAIGARDRNGRVESFNPRGADGAELAPWIDGFCPGTKVSAYLGDGVAEGEKADLSPEDDPPGSQHGTFHGWAKWTGTSFAAAHATGRIAALIAAGMPPAQALRTFREKDPDFTAPVS
jgi:membrane-anchored mycosin MYCP